MTTRIYKHTCANPACRRQFEDTAPRGRSFCNLHCAAAYYRAKHPPAPAAEVPTMECSGKLSLAPGVNLVKEFLRRYGAELTRQRYAQLEQLITGGAS